MPWKANISVFVKSIINVETALAPVSPKNQMAIVYVQIALE
jgi:hypothetical protein